eukprot:CAMPEP_0196139100 /NCGR_PEP_ID=MMETSP0910-20130528/6493_1 /TAXON_ID=49265 /ORGANISM="Thalassiosira rotula, Strain GSO102" /LENGTH=566 /DNA_ID=CAMNT_0041399785 /DNA_START=38 /DNA_END=1738 /DNA_ORIENTATION=+
MSMLTLSLMAAPTVQPFFIPPPLLIPHHSPSSSAAISSSRFAPFTSGVFSSIPSRNVRQINSYGRRRHNVLYSSKSDDSNTDDDGNPKESKMPSDDSALFRDSIDGTESSSDGLTLSDSSLIYEENDDDDEEDDDPYAQTAPSEFAENEDTPINIDSPTSLAKAIARQSRELNTSPLNWSGALSTLRSRVSDIESGKSMNPSTALFRTISRDRPNEAIGRFVREANPEVVAAMTAAVGSLLGSLSNPAMGVETIVQASSEKLGNLCFQLMMTGYMFRNAEYVLALKSLMNIGGEGSSATTLEDYRAAFQRIDTDGSGYLEQDEIEALLADVYEGQPPAFEITTFLEFFDSNNDGRVSWEEFEKGFGVVTKMTEIGAEPKMNQGFSLPASPEEDDAEEDLFGEPAVSGTIQVELDDGKIIEVDAQQYMDDLKQEALELKMELAREKGIDPKTLGIPETKTDAAAGNPFPNQAMPAPSSSGIASYIASLEGDVKSLTQGISPDVVDSMKMLIDFVLDPEGGGDGKAMDKKKEMELPGSALQQLALWQLVNGYRLRETEATGEWKKMLE